MKHISRCVTLVTLIAFSMGILVPGNAGAITARQEEEIAKEFMKQVRRSYYIIRDPMIVNYYKGVAEKIMKELPPQPFKYNFYIVRQDVYNAFAGPGGNIFMNSGLFAAMDSEEELAGILGHEIAHVSCRHISDGIDRSKKIGIGTLAGIATAIFLGIGGAATAASALTIGSVAGSQSISLAYSRENESQADRVGLNYLEKAGYSHEGLLEALTRIREKQWFGSDQIPTYLTTHPAVEDRISYLKTIKQSQAGRTDNKRVNSEAFEMAKAKLIAMYTPLDNALETLSRRLEHEPGSKPANYAYGLALARNGNREKALHYLKTALEMDVFNSYILKDIGKLYLLEGQFSEAKNTLSASLSISPDDHEASLYYGRALLGLGMIEEAVGTFEKLSLSRTQYKEVLYYLGEAYSKKDNSGMAHYYLGRYYRARYDSKNALFHFKKALTLLEEDTRKTEVEEILNKLNNKGKKKNKEEVKDGS